MTGDDVPDLFQVDSRVIVDQDISKSGEATPGKAGMKRPKALRDLLGGFADDLEVANYSILDQG